VVAENGLIRHRSDVTDFPGHYVLGLSWQDTRGSSLLGFVKGRRVHIWLNASLPEQGNPVSLRSRLVTRPTRH
jgi:hypothetical protein